MAKRATLLILLLCGILSQELCAQMNIGVDTLYGNEWIDYNQSYFEIKVSANGIYQISQPELSTAGVFSQATIPTGANFQLFYRGEEIPIYVSTSGSFSGSDYIEFYGKKNDGWLDKFLYVEEDMHPNPDYSMFTDESTYFLTWNTSINNSRYVDYSYSLPSAISKEDYCWRTEKKIYNDAFNRGETFSGSTSSSVAADGISSRYYTAEGYSSNTASSHSVSISTPFPYTTGGDATISTYLNTQNGSHNLSFTLGTTAHSSPTFNGWKVRNESFVSPASTIGSTTMIDIQNASAFRLASVSIEYARTFNFGNTDYFEFALNGSGGDQYIEITNFNASASDPILYDLTNNIRIVATNDAGTIKAVLPSSTTKRNCVLVSTSNLSTVESTEENNFYPFNFDAGEYNYIILSGDPLFGDGNGPNYVQEYANYRDTVSGFDYRPLVVDVEQLYDQFGYGVNRHEQSIKNFLKKASLSESWDVKHLFIIGKGKEKRSLRNASAPNKFDIVPTFGYPHSDYAFVMDHNSIIPWMSVGRLAAYTPDHVRIYLKKMQSYEAALNNTPQTIADKEWMKNVLHFGGGDVTIQSTIQSTLEDLTDIIEPSTFGGDVTNFFTGGGEGSADADLAIDYINEGTSLITFFGHSAPNTVDFDIGAPEDYDSEVEGSFPLFYAIGCNTNRVFDYNSTLSEDYVLIEDKGAIGWYGNTWITFLSSLIPLAENFYENLSTDNYGETFGEIFVQSLTEFNSQVVANSANELVALSSMLHGDPAIQLHPHPNPDYIVDDLLSSTSPKLVALQDDTITLNLEIANIGRFNNEMITVDIEHFDPSNNSIYSSQITVSAPANSSNYMIKIPFSGEASLLGMNQLVITLDQANGITESTNGGEANNQETLSFFVVESDIKLSTPTEFSIFTGGLLTLKASSLDAPANFSNYHFQIDTTENFDSPLLKTTVVNAEGGVIEWQPNVTLINNAVYYWRVSAGDIASSVSLDWKNSSFTYLLGSGEGWNQQHVYQYQKDGLDNFSLDESTGSFDYSKSTKKLKVVNGPRDVLLWIEQVVFEDGFKTDMNNFPCSSGGGTPVDGITIPTNRINVFVYNKNTLTIQERIPAPNCYGENEDRWKIDWHMFDPKNQTSRERWINLIQSTAPGDYVVISNAQSASGGSYGVADWAMDSVSLGTNLFQVLEAQGINTVRTLEQNEHSFIFAFQKDTPGFLPVQTIGAEPSDIVEARTTITGKALKAVMTSTLIGPANSWSSVQWQASEGGINDTTYIKVYGVSADQQTKILLDSTFANSYSLVGLDAAQYPYLELEYITKDSIDRTPAQLDRWRVFYEPASDLAVAPNVSYSFNAPVLSLGDDLMLDFTVSNLSSTAVANAVDVEVTIIDSTGSVVAVKNETLPALGANASSVLILSYNTDTDLGLSEENKYGAIVRINPNQSPLEICYLNNDLGIIEFLIEGCPVNKTLLVTDTYNGVTTVKVSNIITAENTIEAGANVIYSAGTLIHLKPGFHAEANSEFHAFLGGCSLTSPALIIDSGEEGYYENEVDARSTEVETPNRAWSNLKINIIPNPVSDQAQVKFFLPESDKVNIMISDLNGRIVTLLDAMDVQKGWNISRFSAGNLSSGIYLVIIQSEKGVAVERFSIQK